MGSLSLKQVVETLNVPELTVMRWVRQGKIPFIRSGDHFRFPEAELKLWAKTKGLSHISSKNSQAMSNLAEAVQAGGVFALENEAELFPQMLRNVFPHGTPDGLLEALEQREEKLSTAIGSGIAIPHPSNCQPFSFSDSKIGVFFAYPPQDFGARDNQPVFCFFLILALNAKVHLKLMSQVAGFVKDSTRLSDLKRLYETKQLHDVAKLF